ncbi:hypothetical protein GCM10011492_21330 [Flexivirga endophytica]|uniref:Uncharacterized protein n=1 Tax=Flexivirga endophytica TaxID=1849103 RepID=A0A916T5M2_9MICO|nr:hypothetical protein [Flexivirga endophytica]GGB30591.1 hypothetical protein GCM10011492_21330 [Flexivirga endophytica]GHB51497.1 hypothetical protein GCM10008112_20600 [Flexivirga endophytica]
MTVDIEKALAETPTQPMRVDPAQVIHNARRRRFRQRMAVGAAAVASTALVAGVAFGNPFTGQPRTLPASQLPPASTNVTEVTKWYLQKVEAQDCAAVRSLTLAGAGVWCSTPRLKGYKDLQGPDHYNASWLGKPVECLTFERLTSGSGDHTVPSGWSPWELCFNKTASGWRLFSQGNM